MYKTGLFSLLALMLALAGCQSISDTSIDDLPPTAAVPETSEPGTVYIYYYDGISGLSVDDLISAAKYPDNPSEVVALTELARLNKRGDNFGARVRGYIIPPKDANYEFFLASDDNSALYLSTDSSPDNLSRIALVPGWTELQNYSKYSSQRSGNISLTAGNRYYFEVLHKQASGGDHFSVAWSAPGITQTIISSEYLASWAPSIYEEPAAGVDTEEIFSLGYRIGYFDADKDLAFTPDYPPLDQDEDGLYDNWEVYYGLNPANPDDASVDTDGDLLSASEEFLLGTNPTNPDTSGDGLTDGEKYAYGLDPLDPNDLYTEVDGERVNLYDYLHGEPEAPELSREDGFVGHYFIGDQFDEFAMRRLDNTIDFSWGGGSPDASIPGDMFSVRWYGWLYPPHESGTQEYQITIRGDDGVRVWLDGEQIIDGWVPQAPTTYSATVSLDAADGRHELVVEYFESRFDAMVRFWLADPVTGDVIDSTGVIQRPVLELNDDTALVDSDGDSIPDVWELSHGLNPWVDDAQAIYNDQGISNLEAWELGVHPWTLEEVSAPVDSGASEPVTTTPDGSGGVITVSWTAPGTRTDGTSISLSEIDYYLINYGQDSQSLGQQVRVPSGTTNYTFDTLTSGTWYFQVQVVDTDGLTSEGSEVVSANVQ